MRKIREVLRLQLGQGLPQRAVAQSLRLSQGAVHGYIARARRAGLGWPLPGGIDDIQLETLLFPPPSSVAAEQRPMPNWEADEDGRRVHRWRWSAPALASDPAVLSLLDRAPRIFASTFPDWPAFSHAYAGLVAPKTEVTPRVQALADAVTAGAADRREEAKRLYEWVSRRVRWVAIYVGGGAFVPHPAGEVLANGYGDCKDQVALLVALLRARGIAAEPVLVNLGQTYTLSGPPTLSAFNHVITYLRNGTSTPTRRLAGRRSAHCDFRNTASLSCM